MFLSTKPPCPNTYIDANVLGKNNNGTGKTASFF